MSRGATSGLTLLCAGVLAVAALATWTWFSFRPVAHDNSPALTSAVAHAQPPQPAPLSPPAAVPPLIAATLPAASATTSPAELEIAFEDAASPWSKPDGTGCANDIVIAAYKAVGVTVKSKVLPYARGKDLVMNGQIVACVSMSWCDEFEGKVVFPDADKPNFVFYATYVRNLKMPQKGTSEKTIPAGTRIGTVLNYEYPKSVNDLAKQGVVFEPTSSEVTNLRKLAMGRLDYAIVNTDNLKVVETVFKEAGVSGKVGVAFVGDSLPGYIGFSLAHPQWDFARSSFNKGYDIIRSNGTLQKIQDQWRSK